MMSLLSSMSFVLLMLAFFESAAGRVLTPLSAFGRAPLFYYLLHLFVIHGLLSLGTPIAGWVGFLETGALALSVGYPLCRWYGGYKQRHPQQWWWSYL